MFRRIRGDIFERNIFDKLIILRLEEEYFITLLPGRYEKKKFRKSHQYIICEILFADSKIRFLISKLDP